MSTKKGAAAQSPARKLQIQVGVCKRMLKEVASYEAEVIANEARVQRMRDEEVDIYSIRKQEEVLQESYMMVPDSKARLEVAVTTLATRLEEVLSEGVADDAMDDTVSEAREILQYFQQRQEAHIPPSTSSSVAAAAVVPVLSDHSAEELAEGFEDA